MALPKLYELITWVNNTTPALNEDNLNAMSQALDDIDDRVIDLAGTIMEDVPQIQEDMEILEPAIESIDENVARAEAAAESAEQYAEEIAPPIEVVKDFAPIITIEDAINKPVKDLKVKVDAVQDLHGYTKPWVGGAGKNLADISLLESGYYYDSTGEPSGTSSTYCRIPPLAVKGNTTYTLSCTTQIYSVFFFENTTKIGDKVAAGSETKTFTTPANCNYLRISFKGDVSDTTRKIQLEVGNQATTWESYSNICPITGHSEAKVTRAGHNLLRVTATTTTDHGVTFTVNADKTITLSGSADGMAAINVSTKVALPPNNYILSGNGATNVIWDALTLYNGETLVETINLSSVTSSEITLNLASKAFDNVSLSVKRKNNGAVSGTISPMIRLATDTNTEYEPYKGEIFTIDLDGTYYLCELDVTSGVLTVLGAIADMGDLSWSYLSGQAFYANAPADAITPVASGDVDAICTCYERGDYTSGGGLAEYSFAVCDKNWSSSKTILVNDPRYSDPSDFTTAVTGQKILYMLDTPTTVQLTPTEVELLWAYNTLFADTGDLSLAYDASGVLRIANAKLDIDTFKSVVAASSDFADFKTRVAAL